MKKPQPPITISAKNITKISYDKLHGRIAHFPSTSKTNKERFVIISGQHASHERMLSFIYFLADYGDVYAIDMPGFGGMDSFNKIGKEINYESYAEYLYTVLKTRKLNKDITIFSTSIGGQFVTRMFQMYPESQDWVKKMIGFVTFGASKDFHISLPYKISFFTIARLGKFKPTLWLIQLLIFNRVSLTVMLRLFSKFKKKMKTDDEDLRKKFVQMEAYQWTVNDKRTHAITTLMMFKDDLRTRTDDLITVPMHNIITKNDQYIDYKEVNKTMRDLYANYTPHYLKMQVHMPSVVPDKTAVSRMFDQSMIDEIIGPMRSQT